MFNSLSARLFISYLLLTVALLVLFLITLVVQDVVSASGGLRTAQATTQLGAVAAPTMRQISAALQEARVDRAEFAAELGQIAEDFEIRILMVELSTRRIFLDTGGGWLDQTVGEALVPRANDVNPQVGRFVAPDESAWLIYAPVPNATNRGFFVVLAKEIPPPLAFLRDVVAQPLRRSAIAALLLSLALALLVSRWVARPLQNLKKATTEVARGNYALELPLEGPQEVQGVAADFNRMARQVQATQQAQRDFLANVSHDLKTPITSIQGWSQALLDGTAADGAIRQRSAEIINAEAERMSRMVQQLLDLARLESGEYPLQRAPVDVRDVLGDVRDTLALRAQEKQIALELDVQPVPPVLGDRDRLVQLFTNLVDNALTHTPPGGTVKLQTWRESQSVAAAVVDNGPGIRSDDLERIFERFYRADKSRARNGSGHGAGLGLAICREIAENHGGVITAASDGATGAMFTVRLPLP